MPTQVTIVPHQGRTAIAVNGRVIPGMSYTSYVYAQGGENRPAYREVIEAGIDIFLCPWSFHLTKAGATAWPENGKVDFSLLDIQLALISELSEVAWLIPRIYIDTPHWWAQAHPEELVLYADSNGLPPQPRGTHGNPAQASWASERWRMDIDDVLQQLVAYVENGPYADRVLGYMLNSGGTEEWVSWGAQQGKIGDYSAPALRAFRAWLLKKYGALEAIAEAWRQPGLGLEAIHIPSEAARRRGSPYLLRDPKEDQPSIDYDLFYSELGADTLLHFCKTVKDAAPRQILTGSFYGYLLWQTGLTNAAVANGHLALRTLLDSPDIDFITGITSYDNREPDGPGSHMLPVESVQAAGKLVFNEIDVRTHLTPGNPHDKFSATRKGPDVLNIHPLENARESVAVYRREFGHLLTSGCAWWNFDMSSGWYSCPELLEEFATQRRIAQDALAWDMSSLAEVACVVSATSPAAMRFTRMHDVTTVGWTDLQCDRATANLYKAGVPIDWWLMDDLEKLRKYKVIYFHNATWLTNREREMIEELKGEGRTLVFVGHPGMVSEHGISAQTSSEVVSMVLRSDGRQTALVDVTDYTEPIPLHCEEMAILGTPAVFEPTLAVDDTNAGVFGRWRLSGKPAVAVKNHGIWQSIFFPVPPNNTAIFRQIARLAGCHIWCEKDLVLYANRSLLALHTMTYAEPISLPEPMTVTDLYTGKVLAEKATRFTPPGEWGGVTGLFKLER